MLLIKCTWCCRMIEVGKERRIRVTDASGDSHDFHVPCWEKHCKLEVKR